jgi:hypoxanthine-DNA glycosylase
MFETQPARSAAIHPTRKWVAKISDYCAGFHSAARNQPQLHNDDCPATGLNKPATTAKPGGAMTEKRSFPPIVTPETRLLILGSLPGDRSLAARRYYAHPQNQFWRLLSGIIGRDLAALDYEARLAALLEAHIGLWDVVASARREGSSDAAIRDHIGNDLPGLVSTLPHLRAVAFNGATAFRHGSKQLAGVPGIALIALPSSSPLHTVGAAAKQPAWEVLRQYLS